MTETGCLSVAALRAAPDAYLLIDVRGPDEFAAAHIPGARNIPLERLAEEAASLPHGRRPVAVCGKGGGRSAEGAELLRAAGRSDAVWLCGGTNAWLDSQTL